MTSPFAVLLSAATPVRLSLDRTNPGLGSSAGRSGGRAASGRSARYGDTLCPPSSTRPGRWRTLRNEFAALAALCSSLHRGPVGRPDLPAGLDGPRCPEPRHRGRVDAAGRAAPDRRHLPPRPHAESGGRGQRGLGGVDAVADRRRDAGPFRRRDRPPPGRPRRHDPGGLRRPLVDPGGPQRDLRPVHADPPLRLLHARARHPVRRGRPGAGGLRRPADGAGRGVDRARLHRRSSGRPARGLAGPHRADRAAGHHLPGQGGGKGRGGRGARPASRRWRSSSPPCCSSGSPAGARTVRTGRPGTSRCPGDGRQGEALVANLAFTI